MVFLGTVVVPDGNHRSIDAADDEAVSHAAASNRARTAARSSSVLRQTDDAQMSRPILPGYETAMACAMSAPSEKPSRLHLVGICLTTSSASEFRSCGSLNGGFFP